MSINHFSGSIGQISENFARLRPAGDTQAVVNAELQKLGNQFQAQRAAAIAALNEARTPAGEVTFGSAHIAGATGSAKTLQILADLFAGSSDRSRTIG